MLKPLTAAAAESLQLCPTLCDPIDGSPPGSLSLGFPRQEHQSGLPFPSPMHESEVTQSLSHSVVSDLQRCHGLQPSRLLHPWDFLGKSTGVGCHCLLCVDHKKLWKVLKEMGIPGHLICLLRNQFAGQEATVRTGHETIDWFQIGKEVRQGCILSPCLFNLYAEYIIDRKSTRLNSSH